MANNFNLAIIIPPREQMLVKRTGAIGLYVREFFLHSTLVESTKIYMGTDCDYKDLNFIKIQPKKNWWLAKNIAYARAVAKEIKKSGATHIEVHNRPQIFWELRKTLPANVQISLFLHNDPQGIRLLKTSREREKLLAKAHHIYCVSDYVRTRFAEGLKANLDKLHVIPSGIELRVNAPQPPREKNIFIAGRLISDKGVPQLTEAFFNIMHEIPDWNLLMAGEDIEALFQREGGKPGPWAEKLQARLKFLGPVSHEKILDCYARSEISVVPSVWQEPFGRTALEAMACGSALITSGSGGLKEISGKHEETCLIEEPTVPALSAALLRLTKDDALRAKLQHEGKLRAHHHFNIEKLAAQLDALRLT